MALKPEHLAHVPDYLHNDIKVTRKDGKTGAIKVTFGSGCIEYFYKGYRIDLRENVPSGYWGRWKSNCGGYFSTLGAAVAAIDVKTAETGK